MMTNPAIAWIRSPRARRPRPSWHRELVASLRPGIERDTELMPWLIAGSVLYEASVFLGESLPPEWADWLDERAARCCAKHAHFRRLIRRRGNTGRDYLYKFFRHWLASRLRRERYGLFVRLPKEYGVGAPLSRLPMSA
jgi:hypothetical protein